MKMKKLLAAMLLTVSVAASQVMADEPAAQAPAVPAPVAEAQPEAAVVEGTVVDQSGYVHDIGSAYPRRRDTIHNAVHDRAHPHPFYAHGRRGYDATWTHEWNANQAAQYPWHGGYYYPQYGQPVALIVPPTVSYMSNYSWGVGNTTSLPVYHQFGRAYPGAPTGSTPGMFLAPPQWPSNTNQFGVYPVRGPW